MQNTIKIKPKNRKMPFYCLKPHQKAQNWQGSSRSNESWPLGRFWVTMRISAQYTTEICFLKLSTNRIWQVDLSRLMMIMNETNWIESDCRVCDGSGIQYWSNENWNLQYFWWDYFFGLWIWIWKTARFTGVIFDYDKEMEILVTGFSGINRVDLCIMMMVAMWYV